MTLDDRTGQPAAERAPQGRKAKKAARKAADARPPATARRPAPDWALTGEAADAYAHRAVHPEADPADTPSAEPPSAEPAAEAADAADAAGTEEAADGAGPAPEQTPGPPMNSAAAAFDLLHTTHARALTRQAYLLTGHREVAEWAVARAFHVAWERWPEVATDPDPAGWVRAVAYEYALSPWLRFWPGHSGPQPYAGAPELEDFLRVFWSLPRSYRRTLLLHDGLRLSLAETAAETEASTPAAAGRLQHAREALAATVPDLADRGDDERGKLIGELLDRAAASQRVRPEPPRAVRAMSDHATRRWTLAACGLTALIVCTTSASIATHETGDLIPTGIPAAVAELAAR